MSVAGGMVEGTDTLWGSGSDWIKADGDELWLSGAIGSLGDSKLVLPGVRSENGLIDRKYWLGSAWVRFRASPRCRWGFTLGGRSVPSFIGVT